MNKQEFIEQLFKKRSIYADPDQEESMANLLDSVSKDIYSEGQRFVYELVQNADDSAINGKNQVHFHLFGKDILAVSHEGEPFSPDDIISLTKAGSSTKTADARKTGYKGIGFKSVFAKSRNVTIVSDGYSFRFDKKHHGQKKPWQIIPIWTHESDMASEVKTHVLEKSHKVSTIIKLNKPEGLQTELTEMLSNGQVLLFLRHVDKISVSLDGNLIQVIEKQVKSTDAAYSEVILLKNGKEVSSWILKIFESIPIPPEIKTILQSDDEEAPDKLKVAEFTELTLAAKTEKGKIKSLTGDESVIFTYLPTKATQFNFPFLVNGSFITTSSREAVHMDRSWNQWLFGLTAEKVFTWLSLLSGTQYQLQLLHLLPAKFNSLNNELKESFDRSFSKYLPQTSFIPTRTKATKKVGEVLLDKTGLSKEAFIQAESILEFINSTAGKSFKGDCFVHPLLEQQSKLKSLGVETFDMEDFSTFFTSSSFTSRHQVEQNHDLIKFIKEKSDADQAGDWFQAAKKLPFIFDDDGTLCNPGNGICFPTGLNFTELGKIPVIHPVVYKAIERDKPMIDWLGSLGVKEPSTEAYVTNVIIPNLSKPDYINDSNYLEITKYLLKLFNKNGLDEEMLEGLRELKLKITNQGNFEQAQNCYLSDGYQPQLRIEKVIQDVRYVSGEYLKTGIDAIEWNRFFRAIKVKDRIEVETINKNNTIPTLRSLTSPDWVKASKASVEQQIPGSFGFVEDNVIRDIKIPSFLKFVPQDFQYCKLFWQHVIGNPSLPFELVTQATYLYGTGYGLNRFSAKVENYFPWFIKHNKCIPTTTGEILEPSNVFLNRKEFIQEVGDYLPVFDLDGPLLPELWRSILPLKPNIELEDYLFVLERIATDTGEKEVTKNILKQVGLILNRISLLIPDLVESKRKLLNEWGSKNKLPSRNGLFDSISELNWIKIEGFSTATDLVKLVNIPDNCQKDSPRFSELIELFGIKIITEYQHKIVTDTIDLTLKDKFEIILPYLAAVIARRSYSDEKDEFNKLFNILDTTTFFSAKEISIVLKYQDLLISGPTLLVVQEEDRIFYKGVWSNIVVRYQLIPDLAKLLNIQLFVNELRVLLEAQGDDIQQWFEAIGFDKTSVMPGRKFKRPNLDLFRPSTEAEGGGLSGPPDQEVVQTDDTITASSSVISHMEPTEPEPPFVPAVQPSHVDPSSIKIVMMEFPIVSGGTVTFKVFAGMKDDTNKKAAGNWAEDFVNRKLLRMEDGITAVKWENEHLESGKPYDFAIVQNGEEKFIDVKGTPSFQKNIVDLSFAEWQFMLEKGNKYSIYRVYGAGTETAWIEITADPAGLLREGKIFPNPTTLQLGVAM